MQAIPEAVVVDVRAKITWGENPEKVLLFLRAKNIKEEDAIALIKSIVTERAWSVRGYGLRKACFGVLFVLVPIGHYYLTKHSGQGSLFITAGSYVVGAYGVGKISNGLGMILRPRAYTADLSGAGP